MTYCFDLNGTPCGTAVVDFSLVTPMQARIERVNQLFGGGHMIKLSTARGSNTWIDWRDITDDQPSPWRLKHHILILGKPTADVYAFDKACQKRDFEWQIEQNKLVQ